MNCGLLGRKLGHSYSPQIHAMLGAYSYRLYEVEPENLREFVLHGSYHGLNVTIPYKKAVIPFLDELSPEAQKLCAVNTIVRRRDGSLWGHNTDYSGFRSMAQHSGLDFGGRKALVLGSGGASNTVFAVLRELGANPVRISRTGGNNYENLHRHTDAEILVNATPVGMFPDTEAAPLRVESLPNLKGVLDVIYNPARTRLLMDAEKKGLVTENGLRMLVAQAKESAEWFTGDPIPDDVIDKIYTGMRRSMENVVLIGMPGSGKTTIAQTVAKTMGREFRDADVELEQTYGVKVPELIRTRGEEAFRKLEALTLAQLGKQSGLVIATGGGCVVREENFPSLHCNGTIFRLVRDLDKLPTVGRPLSQTGTLAEMFAKRDPMYRRFADFTVDNNGTLEETTAEIMRIWRKLS